MKQFLITLAAVIAGGIILMILPFFFFCMIAAAASSGSTTVVAPKSALVFDLTTAVMDRDQSGADAMIGRLTGDATGILGLDDLKAKLSKAAYDNNIKMLYLVGDGVNASITDLQEVRRLVKQFKSESGKPVIYYSTSASTGSLFVGSVADSVFVAPEGGVNILGMTSQKIYFLKLAQKLGVNFDVFKHGRYKSAVEPYFRTDMSPEDREQTQRYIDVLWSSMRDTIAAARGIEAQVIDDYVDNMEYVGHAKKAYELKLVDGLRYKDQVLATLRGLCDIEAGKEIPSVDITDYEPVPVTECGSEVAVVYAMGGISDGSDDTDQQNIYGDDLALTLRELRQNDDVKAVVMRVNSPGGSALASDLIWREVKLIADQKPMIVSMGTYAASGGYYISCAADYIFAEPTTLTGSIGVFGYIPNIEKLLGENEVRFEEVSSNKNPIITFTKSLSPAAFAKFTESVEETYATFVNRVAEGRGMTFAGVDSIGSGRVWTGVDAVKNGLVDGLGTLDDAIDMAVTGADLAGKDYHIKRYPEVDDSATALMKKLGLNAQASVGKIFFGSRYAEFAKMRDMMDDPQPRIEAVCVDEVKF